MKPVPPVSLDAGCVRNVMCSLMLLPNMCGYAPWIYLAAKNYIRVCTSHLGAAKKSEGKIQPRSSEFT